MRQETKTRNIIKRHLPVIANENHMCSKKNITI